MAAPMEEMQMHAKKLIVFGIMFVMTFSAMSIVGGDTGDEGANSSDGPQPMQGTTPRTVLLEEFTATWCPPCNTLAPALNRIGDEYPHDKFIMLAWHPASSEIGSIVASDRGLYYGWYWLPTGVIDGGGTYTDDTLWRIGATGGPTGSYNDYRTMIDNQLAKPTNLKIDMWGSIEGNKANIMTRIEATDPVTQTDLRAYFVISEDDLYSTNGEQPGRTPYWRHVVRDYGSQPFSISEGEVVYLSQSFNIQPSWKPERLGAVVFVQTNVISGTWTDGSSDYYNREVLQAAEMDFIHDPILFVNDIYNPDLTWYLTNPPIQKLLAYNKYPFDTWDTVSAVDTGAANYKDLPTLSDMEDYSIVVWSTEKRTTTLNASERTSLTSYLDTGSNLFITGSNIGSDLDVADPTFLSDYLHSTFVLGNSGEDQIIGTAGDPISDVYSDSTIYNLKYIKWNGFSWDKETVDYVGNGIERFTRHGIACAEINPIELKDHACLFWLLTSFHIL